jgi:hypothetical protein
MWIQEPYAPTHVGQMVDYYYYYYYLFIFSSEGKISFFEFYLMFKVFAVTY